MFKAEDKIQFVSDLARETFLSSGGNRSIYKACFTEGIAEVASVLGDRLYLVTRKEEASLVFDHEYKYFKLVQEEVKPKPHVHAELIKQWADDPSLIIQCWQLDTVRWRDMSTVKWDVTCKYRIKPDNSVEIESLTNSMAQTLKVITEAEADVEAIKAKIKVLKEE